MEPPTIPRLYPSLNFEDTIVQVDSGDVVSEKVDSKQQLDSENQISSPTATQVNENQKKPGWGLFLFIIVGAPVILTILVGFDTMCRLKRLPVIEESPEIVHRSAFIREMMRDAWNAYDQHAWAYEVLKPVTNETDGLKGNGRSILASMSTLWVMGMRTEFEQGRKWIENKMNFGQLNQDLNVLSVVTEYIGGLLSCFALTRDRMFVDKAKEIGQLIRPAYKSPTGLPHIDVNLKMRNHYTAVDYYQISLSHTAQQLEYRYLVDTTGDTQFEASIESIWEFIRKVKKPRGLYLFWLNIKKSWTSFGSPRSSLWESSNDFYFNLLKSYIQTGGTNREVAQWYVDALDPVKNNGIFTVRSYSATAKSVTPILYAREFDCDRSGSDWRKYDTRFGFSSCQLGAMLSLASRVIQNDYKTNWMEMAENITDGCQVMSDSTKTGLMPAVYDFENGQHEYRYSLSPQLAQSYFILWRLTHKQKYRDYAWNMVQSIHRHCRAKSGGYSSIANVDQVPTVPTNIQPPHFLSATLKYLYLIFTDDSVLPLDQWVFNSAGHPLPICGANGAYPSCGITFTKQFKQTYRYLVQLVS